MEINKINVINFGFAAGIFVGIGTFLWGIAAWKLGLATDVVEIASIWYPGYGPTLTGSIAGGIVAFVEVFLGAMIIAWIYDKLESRRKRK